MMHTLLVTSRGFLSLTEGSRCDILFCDYKLMLVMSWSRSMRGLFVAVPIVPALAPHYHADPIRDGPLTGGKLYVPKP